MAMESIKMTSSAEDEPAVAGSSSVPVGGDIFYSGSVVDPPPSLEDEGAVLGDDDQDVDLIIDEDYVISDDEDDDAGDHDVVDIDSEFEEDDEVPKIDKIGELSAAPCEFLDDQPARLAAIQGTVCFMRFAKSSAPPYPCPCQHGEIIVDVDYHCTRFFRAQRGEGDDGDGVDMHVLGPKQAHLHFVLASPLASGSRSDPVSRSLRFAGAVVAALVYPARFCEILQALWSATTEGVRIPARATYILLTVDVGILRPSDFTPERRMSMCVALESLARERDALPPTAFHYFDVAAELRLPAVIRSEDDVRPKKRRRVTGEDCPICCEVLKEGSLAAWPRCLHIFHAGCLEQLLLRKYQECPLCRSELKLSPTPCGSE